MKKSFKMFLISVVSCCACSIADGTYQKINGRYFDFDVYGEEVKGLARIF